MMLQNQKIPLAFNPGSYSTCDICQLPFCLLPIHKKVHHRNGRENKCAFCGTPFSSVQALTDHLDSHSDTELFCCMCLLPYKSDESLAEHLEGHRELHVVACSKCSRTFASKAGLLAHDCVELQLTVVKVETQEDSSKCSPDLVRSTRGVRHIIRQARKCSFAAAVDTRDPIIISSPELNIVETTSLLKTQPIVAEHESNDEYLPNGPSKALSPKIPPVQLEMKQEVIGVEESLPQVAREPHGVSEVLLSLPEVPRSLPGEPEVLPEVPRSLPGEPEGLPEVPGEPEMLHEVPHSLPGGLEVLPEVPHSLHGEPEVVPEVPHSLPGEPEVLPEADSNTIIIGAGSSAAVHVHVDVPSGIVLPDSPPTESVSQLADDGRSPVQNDADNTADVSSMVSAPEVERVNDATDEKHEVPGKDISQSRPRRSTRKRALVEAPNDVQMLEPEENVTVSIDVARPLDLPGTTEPTPPDSPVLLKRRKLTFCEKIECWNPILKERTWREISDEVREVPLLAPPPKKKNKHKKNRKTNKRKKVLATLERIHEEDEAANESCPEKTVNREVDGISIPTALASPANLRPVLKLPESSSEPEKTKGGPKLRVENRGATMKNAKLLYERYGNDFDYNKCAKVDGRYHCPEPECADNSHRGYGGVKGLRNHIRMTHIDAPLFNCTKCSRAFPTKSRLKEHVILHSSSLPYKCKTCGNRFKTPYLLKQHAGSHEKLLECFHCGKRFSSKRTIFTHLQGGLMDCKCCKLSFRCPTLFRQHESEISHSYKCSLCGSKFLTRSTFDRHVRSVHYDSTTEIDGSFICHVCRRKFITRHNALRHLRRTHDIYTSAERLW